MNTRKQVLIMSALLLMMLVTIGIYGAWYPNRQTDAEAHFEEATANRGAIVFARNCRLCHGDVGEGGALAGRVASAPALNRPTLQGFADSQTTVAAAVRPTDTTIRIQGTGVIPNGALILIDEEQLRVTATSRTELTVQRGVNQTFPAAHSAEMPILVYDEATLAQEVRLITDTIACGRVGTAMPAWSQRHGGPLSDEQIRQLTVLITKNYWELVKEEVDHEDIRTTLVAGVTGQDRTLEVADVTTFNAGDAIRIGDERMKVTGKVVLSGKRGLLTVERGVLGTTPFDHAEGDDVFAYPLPGETSILQQSCGQTARAPVEAAPPGLIEDYTGNVTIEVVAQNVAFDVRTITAPANTLIRVRLDNRDVGVDHNIAFYQSSTNTTQPLVPGSIGTLYKGPGLDDTVFTTPAAGSYFFRCDAHPTTMTGTFVVQ